MVVGCNLVPCLVARSNTVPEAGFSYKVHYTKLGPWLGRAGFCANDDSSDNVVYEWVHALRREWDPQKLFLEPNKYARL